MPDPAAERGMALLEVRGLSMSFGGLRAVQALDLTVAHGEIAGLIGPNGSGKTTVFNLISGLYRATAGRIAFDDGRVELVGRPPHAVVALGIARTFQNQRLFNQMSVLENVLVGMHCRTRAGPAGILFALPAARAERQQAIERGRELLGFFGERLLPRAHDPASTLSYANRRRLEIARALATSPKLLLLDEPAAGMNPTEKRELREDIQRIRARGVAILLIEHDMGLVQGICDRVVVLDHGVTIAEGSFQDVRRNPAVLEAYLGRRHA
jgi:ABC-type branched-subunit amino acid transport system ATPase component